MGILLENLTWVEAEKLLNKNTIVTFPLGAGSKEHGPHLKLDNDYRIAEYLKSEITKSCDVVMGQTLNFGYYPAFTEYPGSISLSHETSTNFIIEICESLNKFGVDKFYIINTGVSTLRPLREAEKKLAEKNIILKYTNLLECFAPIEKEICSQEGGTHADESETSIMLYIAPDRVDMNKAVKDIDLENSSGGLSRTKIQNKVFSKTGIFGDPTLATKEKGKTLIEHLVREIQRDIENLRNQI